MKEFDLIWGRALRLLTRISNLRGPASCATLAIGAYGIAKRLEAKWRAK